MDPSLTEKMPKWSEQLEDELTLLLKDWLKAQGRTQADLRKSLNADSTRMPALVDVLKHEYIQGGLPKIASCLCAIERQWADKIEHEAVQLDHNDLLEQSIDPFGQLDLLLEEIREDCEN